MSFNNHILICDLSVKVFFSKSISLFRYYQNIFLKKYGGELTGTVVELGGEKEYNYQQFVPNASRYRCTNVARNFDEYLDITAMDLKNESQDSFLCISVLEHVFEIKKAFSEITRTLKPGGKLLLTVPFAYPYHDTYDCWRLSKDSYYEFLKGYEIRAFVHLGGKFSSIADNLKRPKEKYNPKYLIYKFIGFIVLLAGKKFEQLDGFPLGYGIYAIKK